MKPCLFKFFAIALMLLQGIQTVSSDPSVIKTYPVPPINENSLFYVQRSKNTNAIVYEINRQPDGKINHDDPVRIYWIRYASDSTSADLTPIQRKYAYGLFSKPYGKTNNSFVLQFVSYKKKSIFLLPAQGGNSYAAYMTINGKFAELKKVFISTSGGTFWFPKIDYVELTGKDPATKLPVSERFVP